MSLTVGQRILLHLIRFSNTEVNDISAPFDITQDGIAVALGITRAHASLSLKIELERELVETWSAHVAGGRSKRHAYVLSHIGRMEARKLMEKISAEGLDPESLIREKRNEPGNCWNTVSGEDRDVFGLVCVLRRPVERAELPETDSPLPLDEDGMVWIPTSTSRNALSFVSEEEKILWHTNASEFWRRRENPDLQEAIYHMNCAGMGREASRLAVVHREELLAHPTQGLYRDIMSLRPEGLSAKDLLILQNEISHLTGHAFEAKSSAKMLREYDRGRGNTFLAMSELVEGRPEDAIRELDEARNYDKTPNNAVVMAETYFALGRMEEAEEALSLAERRIRRGKFPADKARAAMLTGIMAHAKGDEQTALACVMDAAVLSGPGRKVLYDNAINLTRLRRKAAEKENFGTRCSS